MVAEAAMALDRQWQEDVLDSPPSRLVFGLCAVADRGAFLLAEAAPDLAGRFERLRDLFMGHSQGGQPMSDDDLGRAVDELEALIPAVAGRFRDLSARRESR